MRGIERDDVDVHVLESLESLLEEMFDKPVIVSASTTLGHMAALPVLIQDDDAVILDLGMPGMGGIDSAKGVSTAGLEVDPGVDQQAHALGRRTEALAQLSEDLLRLLLGCCQTDASERSPR